MTDLEGEVKIPSTEPEKLFTTIEGKKVEVVELPTIKDEPEPVIHHHNDLDQPSININTDIIGSLAHTDLTGVTANQHHAQIHAPSHLSGGGDDLSGGTIASLNLNSGTLTSPTIGTPAITGGTATNLILVTPTVGTMTATGGTATNLTLVTPTIASFTNATHTHISAAQGGTVDHTSLSSIGTNTHAQIDTHISSSGTAVHSLGDMSTQNSATVTITGGTITNINLVTPTIGTPALTGGTLTNSVLVTPTIGTPTITGGTSTSLNMVTPTIGTPSLTGGTLNPVAYQAGGTVGVDGTAVYVKTVDFGGSSVTYGTIVAVKGIITTIS